MNINPADYGEHNAGSHLPILLRALDLSEKGDVLELGLGTYSTPVLHWICSIQNRRLVSYENNEKYFNEFIKWKKDFHEIYLAKDLSTVDITSNHWSVVLVDQKPTEKRKNSIKRLANNADYIIAHDSEPEKDKYYKYSWVYRFFKYRYDYVKYLPHTTVLSNFINLDILK